VYREKVASSDELRADGNVYANFRLGDAYRKWHISDERAASSLFMRTISNDDPTSGH
jgi:hypothetical protein